VNYKGFAPILIVLIIAAAIGGYLVYSGKINLNQPKQIACTADAKICPDGSVVGRMGPNCEFAACPQVSDETSNWKTYTNKEYGFEFKYPNVFVQNTFNTPKGDVTPLTAESFHINKANIVTVNVYQLNKYKLIDNSGGFIFIYDSTNKKWVHDKTKEVSEFAPQKIESLVEAYLYKSGDSKCNSESLLIPKNNSGYLIEIINTKCMDDEGNQLEGYYELTTDQMLSTFKFLDTTNPEGRFCGGIGANLPENQCPEGYRCKLDGDYPDAGGKCIKK